ncbi:AAA family ATPase [Thermoanaerobacterium sp. DL9XJH110]|uniref:AAA family ATPase n=1 Tax=Thermoanaerobacterium sp. DL9XJH110 TaxID=3386643 RepID=UPI003BB6BF7D
MKLLKLKLANFKGIKSFELITNGGNVNIYGDNATGKTTLFDAFLWLLFDKDSQNRKDFEIKTLQLDGQPVHGLNHEVEAELDVEGKKLTLRKVFKEKWTKKRGSPTAEFTGHTTDYFINGVPVKKADYEAQITSIASEDVFKLLTSPTYFNECLHWQDRRRILLEVCGDVSDEEVIAAEPALARLPDILQGRKLEDHRKVIAARRAEINRELEKIPVRIDEVQQGMPSLEGVVPEKLSEDIAKLKAERQKKQQELARLESGGEMGEKTKALREIEAKLLSLRRAQEERLAQAAEEARKTLATIYEELNALQGEMQAKQREITQKNGTIERLEREMTNLRTEWHRVNQESFDGTDVCPTCGQPMPKSLIEEAKARFNRQKAERLEEISKRGKAAKAEVERLKAENVETEKAIQRMQAQVAELEGKAAEAKEHLKTLGQRQVDLSADLSWAALQEQKNRLEREIEELKAGNLGQTAAIKKELTDLDMALEALEKAAVQVEARKRGLERIEELKAQERMLAAEYERLEEELYLTEKFIQTKVKLLEDKINSRFKLARFKLFNVQVNGAVVECCETTYQGVPYSGGLNNAARINVGLDIINTLAEHYNFAPPIWIDNAEAVTQLIPTKGQMIRLVVSEADKTLRVEAKSHEETARKKEVA